MSRLSSNTTIEERKRGCVFAEDFINSERVIQNGGNITGSPTIDKGVEFTGAADTYIDFGTNCYTNGDFSETTFIIKFRWDGEGKTLLHGKEAIGNLGPRIMVLNDKIIYYLNVSRYKYMNTTLEVGKTYTLAVTTDGTIAGTNLYVDGYLNNGASTAHSDAPFPWTRVVVGGEENRAGSYWNGNVSYLKIFNRKLTPMEIYQDYKQDTEFDDVVHQDLDNSKWGVGANVTKEQLATFEGATDVMKLTATSTNSITISPSPAVDTEVGMLYKATLRVWVPSTDGGVAWYWDTSADGLPRNTTTLTNQWVDLDIYFIATATTTPMFLNPAANGNSVYVDSLVVSKYNSQVCDVDLRFRPEDFNGTSVVNHADATNPFIVDGALPKQLKDGGMKFDGSTTGLVSTNALNTKWHQVENYIVAFRKEPLATNSYVFANRDTAGGGLSILFNNATGNIENYVGTTGLVTANSPYYGVNVFIIQRVFNKYYIYNNGNYIGTTVKGGTGIYTEGKNLWIGKRGGSTSLRLKGDILRLKHTYGYMNEKNVQKCTYDFLRSIKGGETL